MFFTSKWEERQATDDDPFSFVVKTVFDTGGNTRLYLTVLLHENPDDIQVG